jgi:hypothetical protein
MFLCQTAAALEVKSILRTGAITGLLFIPRVNVSMAAVEMMPAGDNS